MTALRIIGAAIAVTGVVPAMFGAMYLFGGTWLLSNLNVSIRIFSLGVAGALMVWIGLRLWNVPVSVPRENLERRSHAT